MAERRRCASESSASALDGEAAAGGLGVLLWWAERKMAVVRVSGKEHEDPCQYRIPSLAKAPSPPSDSPERVHFSRQRRVGRAQSAGLLLGKVELEAHTLYINGRLVRGLAILRQLLAEGEELGGERVRFGQHGGGVRGGRGGGRRRRWRGG